MKKIMFDKKIGLEKAVLERVKDMTRRVEKPLLSIDARVSLDTGGIRDGVIGICAPGASGLLMDYTEIRTAYKAGEVVAMSQSYKDICESLDPCKRLDFIRSVQSVHGTGNHEGLIAWNNKYYVKASLMPHHIRITDVGLERLRDISGEDCLREGVRYTRHPRWSYVDGIYAGGDDSSCCLDDGRCMKMYPDEREAFKDIIRRTCGRGVWESNPYAVVYTFELID